MYSRFLVSLAAALLFIMMSPMAGNSVKPQQINEPRCQEFRKVLGSTIIVKVKCPDHSGRSAVENHGKSNTVSNGPKLKYSVRYFSECTPDMSMRVGCNAIADPTCEGGGWRMFRVISAVNGPRAGRIISVSTYCEAEPPMEIPGAEDDIARVSLSDFRKLPILASSIVSQPEGFSLRNGHAHMYAESTTQDFSITLFDQDVRVRAIPVSYVWGYGDGTSRTFAFPGGPVAQRGFDEATSTSHVYADTGNFGVGLTTRFRGEYSTEGGPWTPIPGVASVPSEQSAMSVWRTKKILVAENCNQGPSSPGCASLIDR